MKRWRHKKRGTVYTEIGRGTFQIAGDTSIADEEAIVIYRGDDGKLWARPVAEFEDGRFEREEDDAQPEDPNRLDLDAVPSGWRFHGLDRWNEAMTTYCCQLARLEGVIGVRYATGTGPTPSAALRAACEKATNDGK